MKLTITLKTAFLIALVCSTFSMAAPPTINNDQIVFDRFFQGTQPDWTEVLIQQPDKNVNSYQIFAGDDWNNGPAISANNTYKTYKTTLSLPSPVLNLICDEAKHLFYIAGNDFVSISSDAATWYTSTKSVEVPFVSIASDGKNYTTRVFLTSEIPNKPSFIPSFVTIGSDSEIQN